MRTDEGHLTALPFLPSVRASVERGDPLAMTRTERLAAWLGTMGVEVSMPLGVGDRELTTSEHLAAITAAAAPRKPDSSQAVTAHPEILDTQTDGDYSHGVLTHPVDSDRRPAQALDGGEAVPRASWSESDRLAFLARAQRIDPRTAK